MLGGEFRISGESAEKNFLHNDICGNKRMITNAVIHMSGPSGNGSEAPNQGGEGQRRGFSSRPWQLVSLAKRQRMMRSVEALFKVCMY